MLKHFIQQSPQTTLYHLMFIFRLPLPSAHCYYLFQFIRVHFVVRLMNKFSVTVENKKEQQKIHWNEFYARHYTVQQRQHQYLKVFSTLTKTLFSCHQQYFVSFVVSEDAREDDVQVMIISIFFFFFCFLYIFLLCLFALQFSAFPLRQWRIKIHWAKKEKVSHCKQFSFFDVIRFSSSFTHSQMHCLSFCEYKKKKLIVVCIHRHFARWFFTFALGLMFFQSTFPLSMFYSLFACRSPVAINYLLRLVNEKKKQKKYYRESTNDRNHMTEGRTHVKKRNRKCRARKSLNDLWTEWMNKNECR